MKKTAIAAFAILAVCLIAIPTNAQCGRSFSRQAVCVQQHVVAAPVVYEQNVVLVPKAFQVQVPLDSYASVGEEYRQAYFARLVAEELYRLSQQRGAIAPTLGGPTGALAANTKIAAILESRCASCHNGQQSPDLSGDPESVSEIARLKSVVQVSAGKMPKKNPGLPQEEYNELVAWSMRTPVPKIPPAIGPTPSPPK